MFALLGIAIGGGIAAGFISGGRLDNLKAFRLRWTPLLFVTLVLGLIPLFVGVSNGLRLALQLISNIGVLAFLVANMIPASRALRVAWAVAFLGWALNFIVIALNGAMPLSLWALERSGQPTDVTPGEGGFFKIEVATDETVLRPLGDVIPIPAITQVVSIGDLVLMAGIGLVIAVGMRRARDDEAAARSV